MRSSWSRTRSGVFVDDIGLGLRMQDNLESCSGSSKRSVTAMSCDHEPAAHELSSSSCSGGGGGSGPLFYSTSNHVTCLGDINDVVASVSASGTGTPDAIAESKSLQYPYFTSDSSPFTFNSSGEMTPSVNERVLFTAAQWQELERQTTIYKYMMASVPVPPELLIPITKNQSNVLPPRSNSSLELGIPSLNSSDPEPWRCKRTDGKKWRCSRDVAPDQKYCERHSHKSRPRSRKPVELHTHDSPRTLTNNNTNTNNNNYSTNPHLFNQKPYFPSHLFMFSSAMAPSASSYDQPRGLEWLLKGEILPVASNYSQEWQHLRRDSIKGNGKVYNFYREEQPLCSNTYRGGHSLQAQRLNDHCSVLSSPKSTTLERALSPSLTQEQETRHFINACSTNSGRDDIGGIGKKSNVSSSEKLVLPHSALTLSMSSGTGSETNNEGNGSAQLSSFGIMGSSDRDHQSASGLRPQWMMSHGGSWMVSPPGLPLFLCGYQLQFLIFPILGLYWQGKQLKGARKVKKRTPSKKAIKIAGQTENKTRSSSKINYDVLKKLLDDEPEEVPGKVEDSKHSNANYADSQQVDENSIPEGHSCGASEENDEHEHDYGETDAGNNDYYNDMYFENEEDDYYYAEDYD